MPNASTDLGRHLARQGGGPFVLLGEAAGAIPLDVEPGPEPFAFLSSDLLLDVDAAVDLESAHAFAKKEGLFLPLPQPAEVPGRARILDVALRAPFFIDAFAQSLDGITADGARVETVTAPRAAIGPDLVGGALFSDLWFLPLRLRLRVLVRESTRVAVAHFPSSGLAAEAVLDVMARGRASLLSARGTEVRVSGGTSGGPLVGPGGTLLPGQPAAVDPLVAFTWGRGRALSAPSPGELAEALGAGGVVGAPQLGRLGHVDAAPPKPVVLRPLPDAAARFADALAAAGSPKGRGAAEGQEARHA